MSDEWRAFSRVFPPPGQPQAVDEPQKMGPLAADHWAVTEPGVHCAACQLPFKAGDCCTIVALGPGPDVEERAKAFAGQAYNAVGAILHWECAVGAEPISPER